MRFVCFDDSKQQYGLGLKHCKQPTLLQVATSRIALLGEVVKGLTGRVDWAEQARMRMKPTSSTTRGDRYGKFKYSTDVIGEDFAAYNREFATYRERFGLAIEQRNKIKRMSAVRPIRRQRCRI